MIEEESFFLICEICGTRYYKRDIETYDDVGYFCPKCKRYVALNFEDKVVLIDTILDLNWNENIVERAININENLYIVEGSDLKDNLVLKVIQIQARAENSFHETDPDEQPFLLLFDSEKYLGFIVWERDIELNVDILQQIFICDSERKQGYGTELLRFWVDNIAKKVEDNEDEYYNGKFCIEISPDSPLWDVLIDLKYVEKVNGKYIPQNFFRTPSY